MDRVDAKKRSWIMSRIKGKNTLPELIVRRFLHENGFRYRLHQKRLPGKPDIVLPKYNTVILVHGCFWHGHEGCKKASLPKTRTEWWKVKMMNNVKNDDKNKMLLKRAGWNVITIWQCELKPSTLESTLAGLKRTLRSD